MASQAVKPSTKAEIRAPIIAIMLFQVAALFVRAYLELQLIDSGTQKLFARDISYLAGPPTTFEVELRRTPKEIREIRLPQ